MRCFAYGTLMFPEILVALLGDSVPMSWATLPDFCRYRIHQSGRTARGPAVARRSDSFVRGRLLQVSQQHWEILHAYETLAGGYLPAEVGVVCDNGDVETAGVYVADDELQRLLQGSWSELEFRERWLDDYVQSRIPSFLQNFRMRGEPRPDCFAVSPTGIC